MDFLLLIFHQKHSSKHGKKRFISRLGLNIFLENVQLYENVWNSIKVCTVDQVLWSRFRIFRWGPQRTTQYSESLNWLNSKANGEEFRILCFYMLCYPPFLAWLNILALNCSLMAFKTLKLKIPLYKFFVFYFWFTKKNI